MDTPAKRKRSTRTKISFTRSQLAAIVAGTIPVTIATLRSGGTQGYKEIAEIMERTIHDLIAVINDPPTLALVSAAAAAEAAPTEGGGRGHARDRHDVPRTLAYEPVGVEKTLAKIL